MTTDGVSIDPIPLSYENRVSELYYMYGLILARSGQCQEASEIVRELSQGVPDDATAIANADYMTEICLTSAFDIVLNSTTTQTTTDTQQLPMNNEPVMGEGVPEGNSPAMEIPQQNTEPPVGEITGGQ